MADSCLTCSRSLSADEPTYTCDGSCKGRAHRTCLGGSSAAVKELTKSGSLFQWMCPGCTESRRNGRSFMADELTSALADLRSQLTADFETRLDAATATFKLTVLAAVGQHIQSRSVPRTGIMTSTNHRNTPLSLAPHAEVTQTTTPADLTNPAKRRLVDRSPPTTVPATPLLTGTAPISSSSSHASLLLPPESPKFWLYLSRFRPTATCQDVQAFVKEQTGIEDVIVIKLVPAVRDLTTLTFTSFKVGMSIEHRDRALARSSWPIGTVFKEFIDRRNTSNTTLDATIDNRKSPTAPVTFTTTSTTSSAAISGPAAKHSGTTTDTTTPAVTISGPASQTASDAARIPSSLSPSPILQ